MTDTAQAERRLGKLADRVLLVDKPEGCTSHDVVLRLRRVLGDRRVGHAGTLDPFATGLLLALVGRGTKLFPMLSSQDKCYEGVIRLGIETTTGDPTGEVTRRAPCEHVTLGEVVSAARGFVGETEQVPPMTSAVKHNGQPLYKLSRRGLEVQRKARKIRIDRFDIGGLTGDRVRFGTRCSKGTYVRTLAVEFGRRLGVGAHLESLRRTAIGSCRVESAASMSVMKSSDPRELLARHGLSLADALCDVPGLRLNPGGVRNVRCGVYPTPKDMLDFDAIPDPGHVVRLLDPAGELVAVGRAVEPDSARTPPVRVELVRVI